MAATVAGLRAILLFSLCRHLRGEELYANGQSRRLRFRCGLVMQEKLAPPPSMILSPWLSTLAQTIPHAFRATAAADASDSTRASAPLAEEHRHGRAVYGISALRPSFLSDLSRTTEQVPASCDAPPPPPHGEKISLRPARDGAWPTRLRQFL